jgi:alanine-synthesizing transaminase
MEEEGHKIIKLNIGNLAVFGFDPPEEIQQDMIRNLPNSAGYSDSKGIFAARKAVMHYTQQQGIKGVTLDDIYLGNGASELIVMATNALLDNGDELLLPSPDYPLWTAAASLSGGTPVHYRATRTTAGCPIWTTSAPRSRPAPRASWSSTPTTRPARCTPTSCCAASWPSPASTAW